MTRPLDIDENHLFTVLSHPLRRKILQTIFLNSNLSFTEMKSWGVKTGTLYFHLKELEGLIDQNQDKQYILNKEGLVVCNWFMVEEKGKAQVEKVDAFSEIGYKIHVFFDSSIFLKLILTVLLIGTLYVSNQFDTVIIGPMIIPIPNWLEIQYVLIINLTGFVVIYIIYYLVLKSGIKGNFPPFYSTLFDIILALSGSILSIFLVYLFNSIFQIDINIMFWIIMSIFCQMFFVLILMSRMIIYGLKPERGMLFSIIILYSTLILSIFFID